CDKCKAEIEPDIRSHSIGNSAREEWKAKVEPDTVSYSAGIRACENGKAKIEPSEQCEKWKETAGAKLEPYIPSSSSSHLVATAGSEKTECASSYSVSRAMWRARTQIARTWLEGGEAVEPDAISYSVGIQCEAEDVHGKWGPFPKADQKKVERRYQRYLHPDGKKSGTFTITGSNGRPTWPLRADVDNMLLLRVTRAKASSKSVRIRRACEAGEGSADCEKCEKQRFLRADRSLECGRPPEVLQRGSSGDEARRKLTM
ncbi:unnamed protein product, partial [Prorocentrum cordatum]